MPCNKEWETAGGKEMPMHDMTDHHVLNAWNRLGELMGEVHGDTYGTEYSQETYYEDLLNSQADLECEAERRWGCEDGEQEIKRRLAEGSRRSTPPVIPKVN